MMLFFIIYFFQIDTTAYLELDFCSLILSENTILTGVLPYESINFVGVTIMPFFSWWRHFYYISTLPGALSRYPIFCCLLAASQFSELLWLDDVLVFLLSWAFTFAFVSTFLPCPACSLAPWALYQSKCRSWNFKTLK